MKPWRAYDGQVLGSNPSRHRFTSNQPLMVGSNPPKLVGSNPPKLVGSNPRYPIAGPTVPRKPARMVVGLRHHLKYARRRKYFRFK